MESITEAGRGNWRGTLHWRGTLRPAALAFAVSLALGVAATPHLSSADPVSHTDAGPPAGVLSPHRLSARAKPTIDRTGHRQVGKASFYAKMFAGRTMADGTKMEPAGNNAASRTLPLGTTARVTNLETGKMAVVTIRDRGPYVAGRIVDLSPATARQIGLDSTTGVTRVEVAPIAVPMPDGRIKLGDGLLEANNNRAQANIRTP